MSNAMTISERKRLHKDAVQYGFGYMALTACRLIRDLLIARILSVELFGLWAGLSVLRQYGAYSGLGAINGLGRLLPKILNEQKQDQAQILLGMAWSTSMAGTFLAVLGIAGWLFMRFEHLSLFEQYGILTIILLMFLNNHYSYLSVILSSTQRIGQAGLWMGLMGALELTFGIGLTYVYGIYGLYMSLLFANVIVLVCMMSRRPLQLRWGFNGHLLRGLLVTGVVLMLIGLVNIGLQSVDRIAILYYEGTTKSLGIYQIGASISIAVSQLPYILTSVLIPAIFRFGKGNVAELRKYTLVPMAMISTLTVTVALGLWIVLPFVIKHLLPEYERALPITGILMLGMTFYSLSMIPGNINVVLERHAWNLIARVLSVFLGLVGSWGALNIGYGMIGVAWVMCTVQALAAFIIIAVMAQDIKIQASHCFLVAVGPILYGAFAFLILRLIFGSLPPTTIPQLIIEVLAYIVILSPLVLIVMRFAWQGSFAGARVADVFRWNERFPQ